jgi:mRNA interferase MazF
LIPFPPLGSLNEADRHRIAVELPIARFDRRDDDEDGVQYPEERQEQEPNKDRNCARSDVILLPIPFTDLSSRKVRPAIVIGKGSFAGDLFVVRLTSQLGNADQVLQDWKSAGLNVPSGIKAQLATVEAGLVLKVIGHL